MLGNVLFEVHIGFRKLDNFVNGSKQLSYKYDASASDHLRRLALTSYGPGISRPRSSRGFVDLGKKPHPYSGGKIPPLLAISSGHEAVFSLHTGRLAGESVLYVFSDLARVVQKATMAENDCCSGHYGLCNGTF